VPPVDWCTAHYSLQGWSIYTRWWIGQKIIISKCRTLVKGKSETMQEKIAHLRQECHNSNFVSFQEKLLKVLKCYNFLRVQQRHNCSPAASFGNCVMTQYLLKVHLQTFPSTPITQKCQIFNCDTHVANEWYILILGFFYHLHKTNIVLYIKCLRKLHYISKNCQENKVNTILKMND